MTTRKRKRESTLSLLRQAHTELLRALKWLDAGAPGRSNSPRLCRWCQIHRDTISRADSHVLHLLNREAGNR